MNEMIKKSNGKRTIPQIFIEGFHVGGYNELRALESKGELDNLVK
jgi:glutaredoxin 3